MELVVLIRESVKVFCRGAAAVPDFFFLRPDFDDGEIYAVKRYIRVVQEGVKEYLFGVHVPSVRCTRKSVSERGASRRRGYRDIFALYFIGTKRKLER